MGQNPPVDNSQLIQLITAIIGGYTVVLGTIGGVVIAFVNRSNNRPKAEGNPDPWDGKDRRADSNGHLALHAALDARLNEVRADIQALGKNLGERIDNLYRRASS